MQSVEIKDNVYWVGALDWNVRDFHGYSTPRGSTYNAYLVRDEKTVLFDTVKKGFGKDLLAQIRQVMDPESIDYVVVNHAELDHTGSLPEIVDAVKPERIICSANGRKALLAHFHREDWPCEVVASGQTMSIGKRTVRFIETRMLHWPDSVFSYIEEDKLLISQDAFGQHWCTSERFDDEVDQSELHYQAAKYYANILLPYSPLIKKLASDMKAMDLAIDMIAPDHGLVWRSSPGSVVEDYRRWCEPLVSRKAVVVYDTMWQSTELMARAVADGLQEEGVSVKVQNLQASHRSDVATELLDAGAVLVGSSTLNNGMLPRVADLLSYIRGLRPLGKIGAAFGSYGWGGEAVKLINQTLEEMKVEVVDPGVRVNYVPAPDDIEQCRDLGRRVGKLVRGRT